MSLVSFDPLVIKGELIGALHSEYVYDDVTTQRAVDYWELYVGRGPCCD